MKRFGLVGYPVGHSYSRAFFEEKFSALGLEDHVYELFEIEYLKEFPELWLKHEDLVGVNVTVPHKENVTRFLDKEDLSAIKVGATNVILKKKGKLIGYNTDYIAFKESLSNWIGAFKGEALILGSGGSSKAVEAALDELKIAFSRISRSKSKGNYTYDQINNQPFIIKRFKLIINTTPLGMHPKVDTCPALPYKHLTEEHFLYDLVYNPKETLFMKNGLKYGAKAKNGLEMLSLQAEKSWDIWNS